jgi:uncharacterized membrane protein
MGAAVAWAAIAVAVVIPHFNEAGTSEFYGRYAGVGGSPGGIVKTAVTHPLRLLEAAFDGAGAQYLAELALPFSVLWAAAPLAALAAVPELALNLLSRTETQTSIHFHYTAVTIPPLLVASVLGAAKLTRDRPRLAGWLGAGAVTVALAANWHLGAVPLWHELPGGEALQHDASHVAGHDHVAMRALARVPGDAVVSATNSLGAHLSARRRILSFPLLLDADWVAVDETRLSTGDRLVARPAAERLVALRRDPRWQLVYSRDGILLFRRR